MEARLNERIYQCKRSGGALGYHRASGSKDVCDKHDCRRCPLLKLLGDSGGYCETNPHGKTKAGAEKENRTETGGDGVMGGEIIPYADKNGG